MHTELGNNPTYIGYTSHENKSINHLVDNNPIFRIIDNSPLKLVFIFNDPYLYLL